MTPITIKMTPITIKMTPTVIKMTPSAIELRLNSGERRTAGKNVPNRVKSRNQSVSKKQEPESCNWLPG
jgi:hypothetical protein